MPDDETPIELPTCRRCGNDDWPMIGDTDLCAECARDVLKPLTEIAREAGW